METRHAECAARLRRHDIDWLRVLAMLAVFFFHNARFFDDIDWHIKNEEHSVAAFIFVGFLSLWLMPLLMLLAGAGSWFALETRTGLEYIRERAGRLLVPLFTLGLFVLIPPQLYWDQVTKGRWTGSFLEFYPQFLKTFELRPGFHFLDFWTGHLWFLRFLFLYALLGLPLLRALKSAAGRRVVGTLAGVCDRRGGLFLAVIPIAAVQIGLRPIWPQDHGGAEFFFLFAFFLSGYLIVSDARFTRVVERHTAACGIVGAACVATLVLLVVGRGYRGWQTPDYSLMCIVFHGIMSLANWCWVAFFLGLGSRYLNFRSKALAYANEAVLPFYVLHQTVILAVGWYVVRWEAAIAVKYAVISVLSFVLITAPYELVVRRVNFLRVLFGMRPTARGTMTARPE